MNKKVFLILTCATVILLIYTVDLFKVKYLLTGWKEFGETPITVSHIQYFVADTPNVIGYNEPGTGNMTTCAETVAYVQTATQETYRCCDTGSGISCLAGGFSSDIPAADEGCTSSLRATFGVPALLTGTREYQAFGVCAENRVAQLTVVQIDTNGRILWKMDKVNDVQIISSVLKFVLGPILILLILRTMMVMSQEKKNKPIPKLWK